MRSFGHSLLIICILIASSCLGLSKSLAADELIFGPEWTFTNDLLIDSDSDSEYTESLIRLRARLIDYCNSTQKCSFRAEYNGDVVSFKNGIELNITVDPGVLEVRAKPLT